MSRYFLKQDPFQFHRWIIVSQLNEKFAWSGSRWVQIGGDVQICNFESAEAAHSYAKEAGLQPCLDRVTEDPVTQ
jgi:hypothetical protein